MGNDNTRGYKSKNHLYRLTLIFLFFFWRRQIKIENKFKKKRNRNNKKETNQLSTNVSDNLNIF